MHDVPHTDPVLDRQRARAHAEAKIRSHGPQRLESQPATRPSPWWIAALGFALGVAWATAMYWAFRP